MTKVKICGITNLDDARYAVECGADALGFNFYEKSTRYISAGSARNIIDKLPENILKIGVFVNETIEEASEIVFSTNIHMAQLHGDESADYAKTLSVHTGVQIIKAFRPTANFASRDVLQYKVEAILIDAYSPTKYGGTGKTVDWTLAKQVARLVPQFYLSGGLSLENVSQAIKMVKPYAVDACSRLESEPGKKDHRKVERFITIARETQ